MSKTTVESLAAEGPDYTEIVRELNTELYEQHKEEDSYFECRTTGFVWMILFDGILLWSSEDDDRDFDEDTDEYEPLMPFIKKRFNQLADKLHKLRF